MLKACQMVSIDSATNISNLVPKLLSTVVQICIAASLIINKTKGARSLGNMSVLFEDLFRNIISGPASDLATGNTSSYIGRISFALLESGF